MDKMSKAIPLSHNPTHPVELGLQGGLTRDGISRNKLPIGWDPRSQPLPLQSYGYTGRGLPLLSTEPDSLWRFLEPPLHLLMRSSFSSVNPC